MSIHSVVEVLPVWMHFQLFHFGLDQDIFLPVTVNCPKIHFLFFLINTLSSFAGGFLETFYLTLVGSSMQVYQQKCLSYKTYVTKE